jgi:peptidoglycan/LPS O-acetylase OafA/YrhL
MDTWIFLAALFLITMIAWLTWATVSKRRTEKKLNDPDAPKSSLAKDGPGPNPATAPRREGVTPQGRRG